MSKQYLSQHTIDNAHPTDIFALAVTPNSILSASGSPSIKIYSTSSTTPNSTNSAPTSADVEDDDYSIAQILKDAHKLGCHHLTTSANAAVAVSVGFAGECRIWRMGNGRWEEDRGIDIDGSEGKNGKGEKGGVWAVALSADGMYLAGTTYDGRVNVWGLEGKGERKKVAEYETKGSFGMSVDLSPDGRFTASGHESGSIFIFSNDTGRILHSLPGLIKPVRAVTFSPGGKLLAAAGDARVIGLYDYVSGEQVANLTGHAAWITSLDWSHTGEYLLSGGLDGKVKVWSVERRECVATHSETEKALWAVRWLPKTERSERFVTAGSECSISFYREATGG